ncbi:MAG: hypothetical protein EPO00_09715 [Chloroflexota bacterium]|nr:MAG: hypothetical protein EPO00_09715 [Chloroflexota bacterium]
MLTSDWVSALAAIGSLAVAVAVGFVALRALWTSNRQLEQAREAELIRQRETHLLDILPFHADAPTLSGPAEAKLRLVVRGRAAMHLTVIVRGRGAYAEAGSSDGRRAVSTGIGSHATAAQPVATLDLTDLLTTEFAPYEETWQVLVTYLGALGQWVVETYEWRIADVAADRRDRLTWQMRGLSIEPREVPGARALTLTFGDD